MEFVSLRVGHGDYECGVCFDYGEQQNAFLKSQANEGDGRFGHC